VDRFCELSDTTPVLVSEYYWIGTWYLPLFHLAFPSLRLLFLEEEEEEERHVSKKVKDPNSRRLVLAHSLAEQEQKATSLP